MIPIQFLLDNEAFAEYLSTKPQLAMRFAEKRLQGASRGSLERLLSALIEYDLLDPNPDAGILDEPEPYTPALVDAFDRVFAAQQLCDIEATAASYVAGQGSVQ